MLDKDRYSDIAALTGKHLSRLEENLREIAEQCDDDVSPSTVDDNSPATNRIQDLQSEESDHGNDTSESFIKD